MRRDREEGPVNLVEHAEFGCYYYLQRQRYVVSSGFSGYGMKKEDLFKFRVLLNRVKWEGHQRKSKHIIWSSAWKREDELLNILAEGNKEGTKYYLRYGTGDKQGRTTRRQGENANDG